MIAAKACGGVKDLKCVAAEVLKHKKSDADGEVLEALLVGGAAGLKLECRSALSTRAFTRRSFSQRDLSETTAQRLKRILLVLKCALAPCCFLKRLRTLALTHIFMNS